MRYASDRLALFRTFFVLSAALLLLIAARVLSAEAIRDLSVRLCASADLVPCGDHAVRTFPAALEQQPRVLPLPDMPLPLKGDAFRAASPEIPPLAERPGRLSEAVSDRLPSWRGLVAFPLPPPASA